MKTLRPWIVSALAAAIGFYAAWHFWPRASDEPALLPPRPESERNDGPKAGLPASASTDSAATIPPAAPLQPVDPVELETRLNELGFVSIDRKFIQPLSYSLFSPDQEAVTPLGIILLELDPNEAAAVRQAFVDSRELLNEELAAVATFQGGTDDLTIQYHLDPEARENLIGNLREKIDAALDPISRLNFEKFSDRSLMTSLLPVPLENVTVTITIDENGRYRAELSGDSGTGIRRARKTLWRVGSPEIVQGQFYGAQALEHFPRLAGDLEKYRVGRQQPRQP